jgi:hypothetical protein
MSTTAGLLKPTDALPVLQRPGDHQSRPSIRRQNIRHAFQAKTSVKLMEAHEEEHGVPRQVYI